ncbi:hypothetical protein OAQ80_01500 [Flavobacteriaceae bacterium]|nr:hypothetical protein [Flavobacteriaceae bacterium]|tara:strand:- start:119 stop:289 length:171 start_codon:yes stop_codon:yes gene_type:complete
MNKNILIRILGISAFSILIITGIYNLLNGEYLEALGTFSLAFSMFVFPQWYKKNQP